MAGADAPAIFVRTAPAPPERDFREMMAPAMDKRPKPWYTSS